MRIGHAASGNNIPGDNTGKEVCIREFYNKTWAIVIRAKDPTTAEKMAISCEKGCNNNCIGYSQPRRNTLKGQAVLANYDLSKVKIDCDCDCSSFMTVCAECAGVPVPYNGTNAPTTRTMADAFGSTGRFDIFTYSNKESLKRGDIIVAPGSHTVMVLDDGLNVSPKYPTLRRGSRNEYVWNWQMYLMQLGLYNGALDGIYGAQTEMAVAEYQRMKNLPQTGTIDIDDWESVGK